MNPCPICQELGSSPTCRVCGHDSSKPVMVSDCCDSTYKFVQMYPEGLDICDKCGEWCHPRTGKPVAPTPLSNCHRAEIFYVQAQAFCSECRNPCEAVERVKPLATPRTDAFDSKISQQMLIKLSQAKPLSEVIGYCLGDFFNHSRQLERDLIAAQEANEGLKKQLEENDKEIGEFQNQVKQKLDAMTGSNVDGAGCDSGDWRDFTLCEISQGVAHVIDERDLLKAAIVKKDEALETAYQFITNDSLGEGCICNIADASDGRITCQSCNDSIAAQNAITQALSTH